MKSSFIVSLGHQIISNTVTDFSFLWNFAEGDNMEGKCCDVCKLAVNVSLNIFCDECIQY